MRAAKDVNLVFGIGVLICFLGFLLHVIGMSTTRWSYRTNPDFEYGVFRYCVGETCRYYSNKNSDQEASQALTIIGAMFGALSLTLACTHVALMVFRRYYEGIAIAAAVSAAVSFLSILTSIIVWTATSHDEYSGVSSEYEIGWSFVISAVGGILTAVGGVLFFVGRE